MRSAVSPTRQAALDGLEYAIHLVDRFGWEPASPEVGHLSLLSTIGIAACQTAPPAHLPVYDVQALMGHLVAQHLDVPLAEWEAEPGRSVDDVTALLLCTTR